MNKYNSIIFVIFSFFAFCSVSCKKKSNKNINQKNNSLFVQIFNKDSANNPVILKNGGKFINDNPRFLVVYNDSIEGKTPFENNFKVKLINDKTGIYITYGLFKKEYYYPQQGDTLLITYKGNVPIIKVSNKNNYEYNITNYIDTKIKKPLSFMEFLVINGRTPKKNEVIATRKSYEDYYAKINTILDSLYSVKKIPNVYYTNIKKIKEIEFYNDLLLMDKKEITEQDKVKILSLAKTDSLLKYPDFRYFIQSYADYSYHIGYVGKTNNQIKESTKGFDSVFNSSYFSEKIKNYLLFYYLEDIIQYYPMTISDEYKKKFNSIKSSDIEQYLSIIKRKYSFDINSNMIVLKSVTGETKSLNEILTENKGKLVYIDFWASWCLPCRKAMPSSRKLREEFESKDVVFLYLSIDKDFDKWKTANTKENLQYYKNSYIIMNQENSEDFKKLGIQTIPRYLIYDKSGKLIYQNAPSPEDIEIRKTFNTLLSK